LESITVLKNEGQHAVYPDRPILPIGGTGKVFVTGPTAHSLNALNGGWTGTWQGNNPLYNTPGRPHLAEAMAGHFGADRIVDAPLTMDFDSEDIYRIVRSIKTARPACVVLGLGEMPYTEFVGNDEDLSLFSNQKELVRTIHALNVPIVGVFIEGRPRTFADIEPLMDAVVMAYLPGDYGGQAIAQVLDGSYNPSGRLPFTWPRHPSAHLTYDHKHADRFEPDSSGGFYPQYPFGHGLSYTTVEYSNFSLKDSIYHLGDTIRGTVEISNAGERTANELVLVFAQDHVASITPSVRRLRDFKRVYVGPGETVTYDLKLPISDLSFVHRDLKDRVEPGAFTLVINETTADFKVE
jgi:beta-glucosidase